MEKITVEGYELKYDLEKVKSQVVKIGTKFYFKHDNNRVIPVKNSLGKIRYFRIDSPLICKDSNTEPKLKSECFLSEDGIYFDKKSNDVVCIDNKWHRRAYCVQVDNKWFLKTDPRISYSPDTGVYFLTVEGIEISKKYYKHNFVQKEVKVVKDVTGEIIKKVDSLTVYNISENKFDTYFKPSLAKSTMGLTYDFQDKTNPQEDRLESVSVFKEDYVANLEKGNIINFPLRDPDFVVIIPKTRLEYFQECKDKYIMPRLLKKLEQVRESINSNYSDLDSNENIAKSFSIIERPFAGKQVLYKPECFGEPIRSKTFKKLGGLEYSFGVEFETSQGLIKSKSLHEDLKIQSVGDRSVGAGEYVTSPMMGDNGVITLKKICKALNNETLVDDRCGLHIHVGSLVEHGKKATSKQAPSFSKQFLMNSINLGAYLEEELFQSLPKNRKPTLYHCHSIRRFAPCTEENFNTNLGAYIFGPKEWWLAPTENCPETLFNFSSYKLNKERNHTKSVGAWANGRYKWLNLIPSYTDCPHRTIEFRIFSGTTSFEKVYAFLLTSLAFTYVADNKSKYIKPGITLSQVFSLTWPKNPEIKSFLNEFYKERKEKFNRTNIYQGLNFDFLK